jgi:glycolate oxidase FAD binding subunit
MSTADLAERIAAAHASRTPLRIRGAGTWLDAQRPCAGEPLDIAPHRGIVEYTPGDLTLTARAGTSLRELADATAAEGQWLGLEPFGSPDGTIGATIATASDGPLAVSYGRARDLVLGLECITGTGALIRAGGRVVKNVAGFDLVRLQVGAWGTLGVITEVTLRLRARPEVDRTVAIVADERAALEAWLAPLADLPLAPLAMELLDAPLADALGLPHGTALLVRLGGNADRVDAQRRSLAQVGDVLDVPTDGFARLAASEPAHALVARVTHERTRLPDTWRHVTASCRLHAAWQPRISASLARGLVRVALPLDADAPRIDDWGEFTRTLAPPGAHVAWERLPAEAWPQVPSAVGDRMSVGLRRALDPAHILNRGLLGEPGAHASERDGTHAAQLADAATTRRAPGATA